MKAEIVHELEVEFKKMVTNVFAKKCTSSALSAVEAVHCTGHSFSPEIKWNGFFRARKNLTEDLSDRSSVT